MPELSCRPETLAQVFSCEFCEISKNTFFHRTPLLLQNYRREVISDFFYPFKPFSILNFAMAEWFSHVTCFNKVYLILFFFLVQTWCFYHKKVVTRKLQHSYHKEVMMLSFLHRWDYCWKCEFGINVKIENYNHHDGEQLPFYKKVPIKHCA